MSSNFESDNDMAVKAVFSAVVVAHNGESIIGDCLESLKRVQSNELEVLVVDNASSDNTLAVVSRVLPSAKVIRLPLNTGYGGGCNAGAHAAHGTLLLFLNQDVLLNPTFLQKIRSKMTEDRTIGICGGRILSLDGTRLVSTGQVFDRWTGYALDYGFGQSDTAMMPKSDEVFSPNGAAFVVRKDVFEEIGGFDDGLFMYFDETDLSWRARIAGFRVVSCADAIARHSIDPLRAHGARSRYYIDRNTLLSATRNYELPTLVLFMVSSLAVRLVSVVALVLARRNKHARSTARALSDFFVLFPRAWSQRDSIRFIRRRRDSEVMTKDVLATPRDVLRVFFASFLPSTSKRINR